MIKVSFKKEALKTIDKLKQAPPPKEIGGVLLGYVYDWGIEVETLTMPSKSDISEPMGFTRKAFETQEKINLAWKESNGTKIYLGEWHTHPEDIPTPSQVDKDMMLSAVNETEMETESLLLLIVGWEKDWLGIQEKLKEINSVQLRCDE